MSELGLQAKITPGPRGAFLVKVDGRTIAEKSEAGFPEEDAVVAALRR